MSLRTRFRDVLALARDFGEVRIAERLPVEGDLALGEVVFEPPDAQGRLTEARGTALQWIEGHLELDLLGRLDIDAAARQVRGGNASAPPVDARSIGDIRCGFMRSEEHTSELQSLMRISYAVSCWKQKTI